MTNPLKSHYLATALTPTRTESPCRPARVRPEPQQEAEAILLRGQGGEAGGLIIILDLFREARVEVKVGEAAGEAEGGQEEMKCIQFTC